MFTLTPLNFVPGEAAAAADAEAPADAAADAAGADAAWLSGAALGLAALGLGLADELQALRMRMGMIAAATDRYRDTTLALLLTLGPSSNILNTRR
jgi:hypothetical protein